MKKSLFIAGLDFSMTSDNLKELFAQHGTVESAKVVTDRDTGRSRGFGFVDMSSQAEAQACVDSLNNATHMNRSLAVKFKEDKPAGSGGFGGNRGGNSRGGFGGGNRW
ncbi:MAG: RNA-binding protein [Burkholderiales bacterium]|nr:RNA-binding protein [Burkholderiales bacterium]